MDGRASETTGGRIPFFVAPLGVLAGLVVWLWPIGVGGRMPVGGDVTQFSLGLMAVLAEAIRAGRLPIWNDLWGFGFPGLAESQMGVYYPPHLLLYGLLPLEAAYTASLVAHTFWGGLGGYWAARRFGVSAAGSALAGFSWAGCGFFVIHLPHQWGYTTGSWMPWAWGLAWTLAQGRGTRLTPVLLAAVLTLQLLPGHFQLAFCTQVSVAMLALAAVAEPGLRRGRDSGWRGVGAMALAMVAVVPLGALQLWPTFRLARLAESQRDYEYLSGFASTPVHLVSYVAPGLFQRSPLWRPVAWDPFRTSPEEHLAYVGLVPLFLAVGVLWRQFRREPATRVLGIVALATLVLSLGPYVPGFRLLIRLPGFSFFRAPSRWSLATELALCLLAGRGFDALRSWQRPGRSLVRFALVAALLPCLVIATIEGALESTRPPGWPVIERGFATAARLLPGPNPLEFRAWMDEARRPQADLRVETALSRQGMSPRGLRFDHERWAIYPRELGMTVALLAALMAIAPLASRSRFLAVALLTLTAVDLWIVSRQRPIDFGPIRPLTEQSRILAQLSRASRATRAVVSAGNLPMVAGAAPVIAYRTLDLPSLVPLSRLAGAPLGRPEINPLIVAALRATGTSIRVLDPFERIQTERSIRADLAGWSSRESVHDPSLAGWMFGTDWVAAQDPQAATFTLWNPGPEAARAWLVPLTPDRSPTILETAAGEPEAILRVFESSKPLSIRSAHPERLDVAVEADGPAVVILSQLADPQWRGFWVGPSGEQPATITPAFAQGKDRGWQAVNVPGPGKWILRMEYHAVDVRSGLIVSGLSLLIGLGVVLRPGRKPPSSSMKADKQ